MEEGPQSDWKDLLGPYGSRAEAEGALARVQARNEAADRADEAEDDWDANPFNDKS